MQVIQLDEAYLKSAKRVLLEQLDVGSGHLSEAFAKGLGFNTHAGLLAELRTAGHGEFRAFDEPSFAHRLVALGYDKPSPVTLPPLARSARYVQSFFEEPSIRVVEMRPSKARFRLDGIPTVVQIDLEDIGDGYTRFVRSHAIHTPMQSGPYHPGRNFDDDPSYAMHRAVESIVSYYRIAVREGHLPDTSWLKAQHISDRPRQSA